MKKIAIFFVALAFLVLVFTPKPAHAALLGIDGGGNLYGISTADASLSLIGSTGISSPGSLEFSPNDILYAFTTGSTSTLFTIDPNTAAATTIGPLGLGFVFEGGLAFSSDGTAYGVNADSSLNPQLFRLNLSTGAATVIGTISGGDHDIDGLAWRSDGQLIGLDRVTNSLLTIDPVTANSSLLASLIPTVGAVGGMTAVGSMGYFSTAGPTISIPGSNELYSFDLFTGSYNLIGGFPSTIGNGIFGIAASPVPEPSTLLLFGVGLAGVGLLRRRFKK